ncbi:MAG: hypothetical protein AAF901_09495 [Bacteroidota bacterium]
MNRILILLIGFLLSNGVSAQIKVKDSTSGVAVSYAAISFGNGNGIFADDEGTFIFNKKLYPDIDSIFISALGYKDLNISTQNLPEELLLAQEINELDEVVIGVINKKRKHQKVTLKPYLDDDYYKCWLPTIESEIAVFFPNSDTKAKQVTGVKFPIALESKDWKKRKRANSDKKSFSTLFKVQFYSNDGGYPGTVLTYETIVFRATEKDGDYHLLNVEDQNIYIPEEGLFVSIQVLGYTDKSGKLLPNKKYKEIKSKNGIVKIPTNFRPLLPFTDEMDTNRTYIKRVFIGGNNWVQFKQGNGFKSSLLDKGYNNYGIGLDLKVYKGE